MGSCANTVGFERRTEPEFSDEGRQVLMSYRVAMYTQDATIGRIETVQRSLVDAASQAGRYTTVDVAVAYATTAGVRLMINRMESGTWQDATKRFLISIDFGTTQPRALDELAAIPNAEVRIPNALAVLRSQKLLPPSTFHPKVFVFRGKSWGEPSAAVIGSANLTRSALATGSEAVVGQAWTGNLTRSERRHLGTLKNTLVWFDDAWRLSTPWEEVADAYRAAYRARPRPRKPPEERTPASRIYSRPTAAPDVSPALNVQLANARSLWFHTGALYKNLGPRKAGNQLDTPRGTRVFFGFEPDGVSRNHRFGEVDIRVNRPGCDFVARSVRFGNNDMDKINLPIAEQNGLDTYDHSYVVFTRVAPSGQGRARFELDVTDGHGVVSRKRAAVNSVELSMASGRQYGLLF